MAKGRMLNRTVSYSLKFAAMPDDSCRLLATWLIPHLDKNGVFYGDPLMVKSLIMPLNPSLSVEQVTGYIKAMVDVGLIQLFTADCRQWLVFPGFADNQPGLHIDREATDFPEPPDDIQRLPETSGNTPDLAGEARQNSPEGKIREEEDKEKGREEVSGARAPDAPPVSESEIDTPEKPEPPDKLDKPEKPRDLLFDAVADVTASNPKLLGSRIAKCTNDLRKIGATPEQVRQVARWFTSNDWRGKRGDKLTFALLAEVWDSGIANKPVVVTNNGHGTRRRQQADEPTQEQIEASRAKARAYIAEHQAIESNVRK